MANPRTVINPFTKHERRMRRETENNRWATVGASTVSGKNYGTENRNTESTGDQFPFSKDANDVSSETRAPSSMIDETKPLPLKPSAVRNNVSHQESPVSALGLVDFSRLEQTWKESDVTVFPEWSAPTEKPESKSNSLWQRQYLDTSPATDQITSLKQTHDQQPGISSSIPCYRAAKQIYEVGPKGEGQKIWQAYLQARSHRQADSKLLENKPAAPLVQEENDNMLPSPLSAYLDGMLVPPLRPQISQMHSYGKRRGPDCQDLRRDSGFSSSSYDAPIATVKTVQSAVNANKPLPLVPKLDAAPKARRAKDGSSEDSRQPTEKKAAHPWWKHSSSRAPQTLKSKISHPGPLTTSNDGMVVNIAAECGGVGGPAAAVSNPMTRTGTHLQPSVYENTKEVERPSPRTFHLLADHAGPSKKNKSKGKEKAKVDDDGGGDDDIHPTHWRDKLVGPAYEAGKSWKQTAMETLDGVHAGRKKRSSGFSFACQGIDEERRDRYQVSEQSSSEDENSAIPDPLRIQRWTRKPH